MNLVPCRECRHLISPNARSCPQCGAPFPARENWSGWGYEWKSKKTWYGYPLIHIAFGKNSQGKLRVAKGVVAIGQFAIGLVTIAQFGIGFLFGFGQFILGLTAIAQVAGGLIFALGQFAFGYIAIGQIAIGYYARCQAGFAKFLWSSKSKHPEAVRFFLNLVRQLSNH